MKASSIRKEIDKLNRELQTLKTELPNFDRLYRENSEAEAKIKAAQREGDETMAALSAARGRVVEARELLEQHRSDISTLEAEIVTLQERYDKQSAGERLAVAKEHHSTLEREYRDSVRHTLDTVEEALRAQLDKRAQVEARRQEITTLGLQLGIFERSKITGSIRGASFARLYPSVLPGVFDDAYPEVRSDRHVLTLLEQLADVDEVVKHREPRQVLAQREANRQIEVKQHSERLRLEAHAMIEGTTAA
jgi:ABC-type transporter Mla subunit MlaD